MSSADTASTTPTAACLMSNERCSEARIPVTTTSCNSWGSLALDVGTALVSAAASAAKSERPMAIDPNVKPDRPALASALTLELALEALAALLTAFRRVFRLIRIPPDQKVLQTRSSRLCPLYGAARYLKFDWNPLNIVSHAHLW